MCASRNLALSDNWGYLRGQHGRVTLCLPFQQGHSQLQIILERVKRLDEKQVFRLAVVSDQQFWLGCHQPSFFGQTHSLQRERKARRTRL